MPKFGWILAALGWLLWGVATERTVASEVLRRDGTPYTVDYWENDDGLPGNEVLALTQTQDGYLWLGTLFGLVRFDGLQFKVFDESNTPGLPSSRIVSLFEDSHRNLWIGTERAGAVLVSQGQLTSLNLGGGGYAGRLRAACEDATGAVWLYTADGQLARDRAGRIERWSLGADRPSACRALIAEPDGPVWVGTDWSLTAIDPRAVTASGKLPVKWTLQVSKLDYLLARRAGGYWRLADGRIQQWRTNHLVKDWGPYPWGRKSVSTACEDRQGNLLVGTLGAGVYWFDARGKATCISTKQGLSNDFILSLQVDREGSVWVGTDGGGLDRIKRQVFDTLEPSRGKVVQSVCEDAHGGLWVGCNEGGVNYWNGHTWQHYGPAQGLFNLSVRSVFVDHSQRVWVGTPGGLLQLRNGRFEPAPGSAQFDRNISAIYQDRAGTLWVGTQGGLARWDGKRWQVLTTHNGLSSDLIDALAEDQAGNLWIGTDGGGLDRLRDGHVTVFHKSANGLPSNYVSSLWADQEGVLWIGTQGSGLARFQAGHWTRYTTSVGLISNSISYLLADGEGRLWIGSNAGLMRVEKQDLNDFARGKISFIPCRTYGKPDGMPTRECTAGSQPGACRSRSGKLWFPTIKGLTWLDPAHLRINTNPPPVMIEAVYVDGQPQDTNGLRRVPLKSVTIPAGKEHLEIDYTSLNLAAPKRARFKYWLEGHEKTWTEAGDTRVAHYSNLPPGHYRFHVTACNEDGVWNPVGSTLAVIVEPPFWRTWWFLSAVTLLLLGTIVAVVHTLSTQRLQRQLERLRQQEVLERERARIARDIHDQLGASLTQVSLLGELVEGDKDLPNEVEAHARQISQTARETTRVLDEIVWTVNPSNDSLDGLITYVCKQAQDYLAVAGLRYRLDVPAQLPATPISPEVRHNVFLAAKEAVTNVVRHAQATEAWLRLNLEPNRFTLEIEDNGRGLPTAGAQAAAMRNGLRNMRKRMEDIGGEFTIGPGAERGTRVRLTVTFGNH